MRVKTQVLENFIKTDRRDIQIQTEEFKEESLSNLHFKVIEVQTNVFKQPTLIYPVTLQELPNNRYL